MERCDALDRGRGLATDNHGKSITVEFQIVSDQLLEEPSSPCEYTSSFRWEASSL